MVGLIVVLILMAWGIILLATKVPVLFSTTEPATAQASDMPNTVIKFTDGPYTCYIYNEYAAFLQYGTGGISCVK